MRQATQNASKARNARKKKSRDDSISKASSVDASEAADRSLESDNHSVVSRGSVGENSLKDSDSELSIIKNLPRRGEGGVQGDDDGSTAWGNRKMIMIGKQGDDGGKFQLETCTELLFISLVGEQRSVKLNKRISSYSELQREIARYTPNSRQMFAIQDARKEPIFSKNFDTYDLIRIKEIAVKPDRRMIYSLHRDWEKEDYHEVKLTAEEKQLLEEQAAAEDAAKIQRMLQYY